MEENTINKYIKFLILILGFMSLVLGIIGIFLPIMPTTPFILLAAACFSRSSKRLYDKLLQNKYLGRSIKDYREGRGVPLKVKIISLTLLWASIGYSAIFIVSLLPVKILLLLIAVGVTTHLIMVKTYKD